MSDDALFQKEEFEAYFKDVKKFDSERWKKNIDEKLLMDNVGPGDYDPGNKTLEKNKGDFGTFLNDEGGHYIVTIESDSNTHRGTSFGFVDCFVRVSSQSSFISGTLVLKYDKDKLGSVERDTLRIFKWNDSNEYFQLVEMSAAGRDGEYVWARITSPGRYAIIGLNTDTEKKIFLRTILSSIGLVKNLKPEVQKVFLCNIAKTIIGPDPISDAFKDGKDLLDFGTK